MIPISYFTKENRLFLREYFYLYRRKQKIFSFQMMKRLYIYLLLLLVACGVSTAATKDVKLKFIETSDIHGNYFPYNFIEQQPWGGSLARVYALVQKERERYGDNLLLFDNGDILQGQPSAYYYNYIDTSSVHLAADIMNYMGYDVGNMGNHDIETGHAVYDRWIKQCNFPVLGANIVRTSDETTYLKPYEIIERDGVKIAILGMITPAIPVWLSENSWKGLVFNDMETTARKWMKIIREEEKPDLIVGIFHAGNKARTLADEFREDASLEIAERIPGFDIIMMGHDHRRFCEKIVNINGDSVLLINPASNGKVVGSVDVTVTLKDGIVQSKQISGSLPEVEPHGISKDFMQAFAPQYKTIEEFVSRKIGTFTDSLSTRPAFFGPSAFIDFIHTLQLDMTGADISFAAPLSFDATIQKGDVKINDMFNLYKYENMLYTMSLTGAEIKGFLEMSYALWTNQMKSADDHILLVKEKKGDEGYATFINYSFNFDSAAGLIYTVNVTQPKGNKITIISMANGTPFDPNRTYKVALNSYRGNGGGELLTKGAGIPKEELKNRIITSTDKDLRYYMIKYIENKGILSPKPLNQWKLIPEKWAKPASERDYQYLFGKN